MCNISKASVEWKYYNHIVRKYVNYLIKLFFGYQTP